MGCLCAIKTDEYHGFECSISGGACMYLYFCNYSTIYRSISREYE